MGFLNKLFNRDKKEKLDSGVQKTKTGLWNKLNRIVSSKRQVDDDLLDDLEEALVTSDVGVETTLHVIDRLKKRVADDKYVNTEELAAMLSDEICDMIGEKSIVDDERNNDFEIDKSKGIPYVILVVGINGAGKTTTIGKLAYQYKQAGYNVMLGAGDTYRAAADSQLEVWADRVGVPMIKHQKGGDPSAVAFDTLQSAKARGADIVIIDTAGRLHNQKGLMEELAKIQRTMKKVVPDAPHEVILVLDASIGQNAVEQARNFLNTVSVNCLAVTKLDGTAKGGAVISVCDQFKVPIKYIGVGEKLEDLQIFRPKEFVRSLFQSAIEK